MHQRLSIAGLTTKDLWPCALPRQHLLTIKLCVIKFNSLRRSARLTSATANVITTAVNTQAPTASVAHRELRGARTPSQLAEDLYQYATLAASTGHRPGNDAFLAACLSDLSAPHRLRRLRPRQLATLLRALVHLGAHPGEDWLTDLDACCYCHPGPFDPASATAVLQALAALHSASPGANAALSNSSSAYGSGTTASSYSASDAEQSTTASFHAAYWGDYPSSKAQEQRQLHRQRGAGKSQTYSSPSSASKSLQKAQRRGQQRTTSTFRGPGQRLSSAHASSTTLTASSPLTAYTKVSTTYIGSAPAASFLFPHAVYLRLAQGGVYNYTYDQLATLLQSFRSLGVTVSDELALQVGSRMAALLLEMAPEQRQRALTAVLGTGATPGS